LKHGKEYLEPIHQFVFLVIKEDVFIVERQDHEIHVPAIEQTLRKHDENEARKD
jgi:hypothetical protein